MFRYVTTSALAGALALVTAGSVVAQDTRAEPNFLAVGTMAPDFEIPGATRWGPLAAPLKLSDFRGEAVVLAFFPAARTRGCTIQMETYRDEYQRVFNGGRNVVLIPISYDSPEALASWAKDADFPFVFGSDSDGAVYRSFGGVPSGRGTLGRTLVAIDAEGMIAELQPRFLEIDPTSYDALETLVDRIAPPAEDHSGGEC
jgi:peroxiredoxin Q/BCP